MKTSAEKSSTTTSATATHAANRPFFSKTGEGGFFTPQRPTGAPFVQMKMAVNMPGDKFEQEADKMAGKVMRMSSPASGEKKLPGQTEEKLQKKEKEKEEKIQRAAISGEKTPKKEEEKIQKTPEKEEKLQRKGDYGAPAIGSNTQSAIQNKITGGQPISSDVRSYMEPRFNADFSNVRIHSDTESAGLSNQLSARAFTYQNNIFFSSGQYQPGTSEGKQLLAHELTHTLQQGAGIQRSNNGVPLIQREERQSSWLGDLVNFGESAGLKLLQEAAPSLVPIVQKGPEGVFDWLKERAGVAVEGIFNSLMTPVRAITGVGEQLSSRFAPILATIQEAGAKIARNDCSPLREAAEKIEKTAEKLITPIIEKLQPVVVKVKAFLTNLWDKLGVPIWEWIKQYAADQWAQIQYIAGLIQKAAKWIWDKTSLFRTLANKIWAWFKNKLGVGEGVEGQDGLLQWVQRKLEAAWAVLKAKLEPFKSQLVAVGTWVGGVALAFSPAGPVLAIAAAVLGAAQGLRWIYTNWGKGNMVVQARVYLEKTLIPPLQGAVKRLGASVSRMADSISKALSNFAAGMTRAVGSLGGSLLSFAISAVQWIADQVTVLADWARQQLGQLSQWFGGALGKLEIFLHRMLQFFAEVGGVVLDIWGLPILLAGELWEKVPACIRTPIEDFLGQLILKQIELFQELVKDNKAWLKTKAEVGNIIRLVFKDHNLIGAVKATFFLILRVFNLPPDMLVTVARKAASAWDTISKKPLDFIRNTVRSLGHGFKLLWANISMHLQFGLEGWLFGELKDKNISPPKSWTDPKELFWFVLDVLGLSVKHLWELLAQRFPPEKVQKVRDWFGKIERAVDWVNKVIDTSKTPEENSKGLVKQAENFGATILSGIAEWVAGKVSEELAILAAGAAASAGLSEVLDVARRIYKAMVTVKRWARKILDMANETLDNIAAIASGAIEVVGGTFEKIMHKGMPVVIGFLADQVGLGGVGKALRETVDKLRKNVDDAILWLIDKVKAGIEALIGKLFGKKDKTDERTEEQKQADLDKAMDEAESLGSKTGITETEIIEGLKPIKNKYKMVSLALVVDAKSEADETVHIEGEINPKATGLPKKINKNSGKTESDAIEFTWVKPKVEGYPKISIMQAGKRVTVGPFDKPVVGGIQLGVTYPDALKIGPNKTLQLKKKEVSNSVKDDMNKKLNANGYDRNEGDQKPRDTDHIVEKQLGGPDELGNLWPLNETVNRESGGKVRSQVDEIKKITGRSTVEKLWIKFKF